MSQPNVRRLSRPTVHAWPCLCSSGFSCNIIQSTRTTHVHDALRRAVPVRMCALRMRVGHGAQERLRFNRAWKVSIIYTWLVKTLHSVLSSFAFSCSRLALLASTVPWLCCIFFLNAANRRLRSVLDSAKCVRCRWPTALFYLSSIVKKRRSSLSSNGSITRLGIRYSPAHDVSSSVCTWAQIDIPERDRQVCTYIARIDPSFKASC